MRFLRPELAVWFAIIPPIVCAWAWHVRAKSRFRRDTVTAELRALSRLTTWRREALLLGAAVVALAGLVLALMRPQILLESRTPEYEREDLVIVLDHSASMNAEDVQPSRFGRAVQEIKTFLAHKPDIIDRVGLVEFAGTSLILSHLTRDVDSLSFYLDWIVESPEVRFGTDIGAALASARELSRKDNKPTTKIFLVISDGSDQGTALARELAAVRAERTRVYCIGVGADPEAAIPVADANGMQTLLEDDRGRVLSAGFDESTLRALAAETGGRYVRSMTGADLATAMRDVITRERRLLSWNTRVDYKDVYLEMLTGAAIAAGVVLLLL